MSPPLHSPGVHLKAESNQPESKEAIVGLTMILSANESNSCAHKNIIICQDCERSNVRMID